MTNELPPRPTLTLLQFLTGAGLFEGALLLVAFALGFVVDVHPTAELVWSWQDFGIGLLATVPMLFLLAACFLSNANGLRQIREFLRETLGPLLDRCRIVDILFLALLAGICEEVLFRGLLYQWIRAWNPTLAIMVCNLLFALAHSITPLYAMLAGFIGLYLTALMTVDSTPNLLIPITAHAAYDFVAFLVILWDYRRTADESSRPS
ncbi:MAG: type II CAAX endopeptidase family protein [Fuerstiella sp.]|nr:type II CAAX endopeptidase family protein [Fuerstiella sp.]